jgi:hypothetical protein
MARILTPPAVCDDPPMPHYSIQSWATFGANPAPQQTYKTERDMCTPLKNEYVPAGFVLRRS